MSLSQYMLYNHHVVDLNELALQVTTDPDHKFDLSLQLDDLDTATEIARSLPEIESETKWKALGDRALALWRFDLARESFEKAGDLSALMLLLLATGDREGLRELAAKAGKFVCNIFSIGAHLVVIVQRRRDKTILLSHLCFSWATRVHVSI